MGNEAQAAATGHGERRRHNCRMFHGPAQFLPAHEYRRLRWRNGAGWTREILALPDPERWDLRLSIAEIEAPAAYSPFPGMLREQVLLAGNGLRLDFADGQQVELAPPYQRVRFSGERDLVAMPVDGPVQAFNLIWRPSALEVELLHRPLVGGMFCFADAETAWVLHLLGGTARISGDGGEQLLASGDSAWLASTQRRRFAIDGAGEALLLRVGRAGGVESPRFQ